METHYLTTTFNFVTSNGWGGGGGHGWTASNGSLTGSIPANKPIIIKVIGSCGNTANTIYTATVGPFYSKY